MRQLRVPEKLAGLSLFSFVFFTGFYFRFHVEILTSRKFYQIEVQRKNLTSRRYQEKTVLFRPTCENILNNITKGRWKKKVDLPLYKDHIQYWIQREDRLEKELQEFWVKRGIQKAFWRPDFRCGYRNFEEKPPNSTWPLVGSWCDARGERPCCTDAMNGACMKPSKRNCDCPSCVDLRKYIYADVSDWVVDDERCKWNYYSAAEACDVIETSAFSDIHFVGDSFSRNMFRTFVTLVTNDMEYGAMNHSTPLNILQRCTEMQQFFWKECRETIYNMSSSLQINKLCGGRGHAKFSASLQPYYNNKFKGHFLELVKNNIGKPGTLIIVSVGFHMGCISEKETSLYLGPAVDAIEEHYGGPAGPIHATKLSGRWPQIILSLPLSIGLLKPTVYLKVQNKLKCDKYSREMKKYAEKHDIRVLDFRPLTDMVHSFDGTHHGMNVNLLKNQILLNYIASSK